MVLNQHGNPILVINKVFKKLQSKQSETTLIGTGNEERNNNVKNHLIILPYKGSDTMHIISFIRKQVNRAFPDYVKMMVSYTDKNFSSCFNVKNNTVFNHEHNIVCHAKCPEES